MPMNPRLLRPRQTGFDPRSISGLALWLDAADASTITLVSGAVSEWRDKAAGRLFIQTTANNRPGLTTINGRNALLFDGSNDTLECANPFGTVPFSVFIVQRVVAYSSFAMTYAVGASNSFNIRQFSATGQPEIETPGGVVRSSSATFSTSVPQLVSLVYDSTIASSAFYLNNAAIATSGTYTTPTLTGTHYIGSRAGAFLLNGHIAEILVYSRTVTATERAYVSAALGKKWGVTVA